MPRINLVGAVVKTKYDNCDGQGCPVRYCKMLDPKSPNKCLGYYDMVDCVGGKCKMWRCEYVKP